MFGRKALYFEGFFETCQPPDDSSRMEQAAVATLLFVKLFYIYHLLYVYDILYTYIHTVSAKKVVQCIHKYRFLNYFFLYGSLHWVEDYSIGPSERENGLQLFITREKEKDELLCMAELKKEFGEDIVNYVEITPGTDAVFEYLGNGNNCDYASSTTKSRQNDGPMSGDAIYIDGDIPDSYGSLGIFIADDTGKHFATTCYHVSYDGRKLPKNDIAKRHQKLNKDSENTNSITRSCRYRYRCRSEENENEEKQEDEGKIENYKQQEQQQAMEIINEGNSNGVGDLGIDCHSADEEEGRHKEMNVLEGNGEKERRRVAKEPEATTNDEMEVDVNHEHEEEREKEEDEDEIGGGKKGKSGARNENKGCMLGKFSWGVLNERHDISLIELERGLNCFCTMSDIDNEQDPENCKQYIAHKLREHRKVIVEKTGFSTGTTKGIVYRYGFCDLKGRNLRLRKCYLVKSENPDKPFSAPGDSGSVVKLVRKGNKKLPFSYLSLWKNLTKNDQSPFDERQVEYVCFNLQNSLNEHERFKTKDLKACLGSCAAATSR